MPWTAAEQSVAFPFGKKYARIIAQETVMQNGYA